ncbi:hypothetical protein [Teredinibacter franksiae]|uniref:hypothetical protein n=1 Tax=Teredinibacter franksiae TaxID=2761453 RepID=UPI00162A13B4|nr:hypothetical protein [Teredinibacter franksiae]
MNDSKKEYVDPFDFGDNIKLGRVEVVVSSFKENNIGLVFLAECSFPASDRSGIYVEVVLNSKGTVYVEQISAYSTVKNA